MSIVTPYLENLDRIKADLPKIANRIVLEEKDEIIELIQDYQLGQGLNSDGKPLRWSGGNGYYKSITQQIAYDSNTWNREEMKPSGLAYNFNWSGQTFDFMDVKTLRNGDFSIFTINSKQRLLESIYGRIFDLTDELNEYINIEILLPKLNQYILDNMCLI